MKVFVDVVNDPDTFLWRPTKDKPYLGNSLKSFVAWPAKKCVFESSPDATSDKSPAQKNSPSAKASSNSSPKVAASTTPKGSHSTTPSSKSPKKKAPSPSPEPVAVVKKVKPTPQSPVRRSLVIFFYV